MPQKVDKVVILGTGTMGAGLAALCASIGMEVDFLDMPATDGDRNALAAKAKEAMLGGRAPMLEDEAAADRISIGNFEDDFDRVGEADWVVEAIIEDLAIKRDMFQRIEEIRRDGSIVTSNTSGILLHQITDGLPERLRHDIAITHFFNPVKVMKLVELIPGEDTSPEVIDTLSDILNNRMNKGVVWAKDTVNFIANRIGCFWMLAGMGHTDDALSAGLSMEEIDAALGAPVGIPPTALYGLLDLIGLDVMSLVAVNLDRNLDETDMSRRFTTFPTKIAAMLERGQIGRKAGGGFYRMRAGDDGNKVKEIFDLTGENWRDAAKVELPEEKQNLNGLLMADDALGDFVRKVVGGTLEYAADLVPEISDDVVNIDRAMRWGFNWQQGPFEMLDAIGLDNVIPELEKAGRPLPAMMQILQDAGAESFYRNDGKEFLGTDGSYHPV